MIWTFITSLEQLLGFPGGSVVKNLPAKQKMQVRSLGQEDPLEEGTPDLFFFILVSICSSDSNVIFNFFLQC